VNGYCNTFEALQRCSVAKPLPYSVLAPSHLTARHQNVFCHPHGKKFQPPQESARTSRLITTITQSSKMPKENKHSRGRRDEKKEKKRKRDNGEDEPSKRRKSQDADPAPEDVEFTGMQGDWVPFISLMISRLRMLTPQTHRPRQQRAHPEWRRNNSY